MKYTAGLDRIIREISDSYSVVRETECVKGRPPKKIRMGRQFSCQPKNKVRPSARPRLVYVLWDTVSCYSKVGISKNIESRVRNFQVINENIQLYATVPCDTPKEAANIEAQVKEALSEFRAPRGTEWFQMPPSEVLDCVILHQELRTGTSSTPEYFT